MEEGGERSPDDLSNAKQGIQSLARIYPDFGGERWKRSSKVGEDIQREEEILSKKTGS